MAETAQSSGNTKPTESTSAKPGFTTSSADRLPKGGKGRDDNRAKNHEKHSAAQTITASLDIRGFPTLRAKRDITIANAGPAISGQYYVKKVRHGWRQGQGYLTTSMELIQSKGQDGDRSGDCNEAVIYGDLYDRGEIYVGPRKIGQQSQTTLTWGDGNWIIRMNWKFDAQSNRGGNERCTGGLKDGITGGAASSTTSKAKDQEQSPKTSGGAGVDPREEGKYLSSKELLTEDIQSAMYWYKWEA